MLCYLALLVSSNTGVNLTAPGLYNVSLTKYKNSVFNIVETGTNVSFSHTRTFNVFFYSNYEGSLKLFGNILGASRFNSAAFQNSTGFFSIIPTETDNVTLYVEIGPAEGAPFLFYNSTAHEADNSGLPFGLTILAYITGTIAAALTIVALYYAAKCATSKPTDVQYVDVAPEDLLAETRNNSLMRVSYPE